MTDRDTGSGQPRLTIRRGTIRAVPRSCLYGIAEGEAAQGPSMVEVFSNALEQRAIERLTEQGVGVTPESVHGEVWKMLGEYVDSWEGNEGNKRGVK